MQNVLFSDTPNAGTLLVLIHRPVVIVSYLEFFMIIAFSKLAAITISFVLVRRSRQSLAEYQKQ